MSFWWLAGKDLLLIGRDKQAFLTLIMMPLILIAILGAAFGNMMEEEDVTIGKFTLGVVNLDSGPLGKVLAQDVFTKGLKDVISTEYYPQDKLEEKIRDHKLQVGIIIPKNFSSSLMSGEETEIKLISGPNSGIKTTVVQSVIEQFISSAVLEIETAKLSLAKVTQTGMPTESFKEAMPKSNQQKGEEPINISLLNEKTINPEMEPVGSFQYYAAAMGVMFLLMTVTMGVSAMILEKGQEVYKRLLVTRLSYGNYLAGKMLGLIIVSLIQAFVLIIGTNLLFDVDWGDSSAGVVVITVSFVTSACGLGIFIGSFIKKEKTFSVAAMLGTQIMAALGGSMAPLYVFPDWAVLAGKFLPNGLALQTYLDLMTGASLSEILLEASGAIGIGIVFFALGIIRLSIERRESYA